MGLSDIYGGGFDLIRTAQPKPQSEGIESLKLTPQERFLYNLHKNNLQNAPVKNPDGSVSTLRQMTVEIGGKIYNLPTVWNGSVVDPDKAIELAHKVGIDKFPSYANQGEAEARYEAMHKFMGQDVQKFLEQNRQK